MTNTTLAEESDASLDTTGFMAYCILIIVITLLAGVVMGTTAVALTMAKSIPRTLRLFLINLLLAGFFMGFGAIFIVGTAVILVGLGSEHPRPPLYLCRAYTWMFGVGAVARLWSLAAFSLSVLTIVRFGKKTISLHCAAVITTILWIVPISINIYVLLPYVYEAQFVSGVACFPDRNNIIIFQATHVLFTNWVTSGGAIPIGISIAVPIVCLCYIKKNVVTEEAHYRKGIAKFSLFLVLGAAINIAGQLIPGVVALNSAAPGVYLSYGIGAASLLPTPIIIIAYLKPVQEQVKKIVTCGKLPKDTRGSKSTTSTSGTNGADHKV